MHYDVPVNTSYLAVHALWAKVGDLTGLGRPQGAAFAVKSPGNVPGTVHSLCPYQDYMNGLWYMVCEVRVYLSIYPL